MDTIQTSKVNDDYISISGLSRQDWELFWHPNNNLVSRLKEVGIQAYILDGTIYGCFINKLDDGSFETQWFGYHLSTKKNLEGKIVPNSTWDLDQIFDLCDPAKVESLLFHLDILSDKIKKN